MTIKEAQEAVDQWIKEYGVRYFSELTNMACLTEEVGELACFVILACFLRYYFFYILPMYWLCRLGRFLIRSTRR